jgi:hypothetical protein
MTTCLIGLNREKQIREALPAEGRDVASLQDPANTRPGKLYPDERLQFVNERLLRFC